MKDTSFDYIILGAGAAGLSLAYRMAQDTFFRSKKIALVDHSKKNKNDRTWSFWEKGEGVFDSVVSKEWSRLKFYSKTLDKSLDIAPYRYKMIKGIDFYNHTLNTIRTSPNIHIIHDTVCKVDEHNDRVRINLSNRSIETSLVLKSYPSVAFEKAKKHTYVDQHFKGYFIKTQKPVFDPNEAIFMDFRIDQKGEARFLYVLPESSTHALIEVAIFSNEHLSVSEYNTILDDYIEKYLDIDKFEILEEEMGVIPMTTYPFDKHNTKRIFHIGTGGGIVKASSGYAFSRIQKHSDQLIDCLKNNQPLEKSYRGLHGRFRFYDRIMLHAMLENGASGEKVFTSLFKHKKASKIFKFLDQRTTFFEDLDIFTAPPMVPFTKSFFQLLSK